MIERKTFLKITKAMLFGLRHSLTDPSASIKQTIIEELASILSIERCVLFKIYKADYHGTLREYCEIVAGVPYEEYKPDLRNAELLDDHPDIKAAAENENLSVVRDPLTNEKTTYFSGIVEKKGISEIVYIPLFIEVDGQAAGIIVIDGVQGRQFSDDEIEFCSEVAELISMLLNQERAILQHFRDAIINKIVPLGGFAGRLRKNLQVTLDYIEIIQKEAGDINNILPQKMSGVL